MAGLHITIGIQKIILFIIRKEWYTILSPNNQRIMKIYILILIVTLISSCSSHEPDPKINIEAGIGFYVLDDTGNDLLDPNITNSYDFTKIKVYDVIDEVNVLINNSNLDAPKGISLLAPEGKYKNYRLSLAFNTTLEENFNIRIIKWNSTDEDVFKVEFDKGAGYMIIKKVWLNNELVWDIQNNIAERFFTIIK